MHFTQLLNFNYSLIKRIPRTVSALAVILFAITADGINQMEASITATPSDYAVKDQEGNLLMPDDGSTNVYTIAIGTTLTFEVAAQIAPESDDDELVCEWYNNNNPNNENLIATLGWWWWISTGKNPAAPEEAPEQTNTPIAPANAPANTTKGGLYSIQQTFNDAIPPDTLIKITAVLYPAVTDVTPYPTVVIPFFIQVIGGSDITPPILTPSPASDEIVIGVADRVSLHLNAVDPEDHLEAIEWYVEGFNLPLRANGSKTLNLFFGSPNEDSFNYRFEQAGTFKLTALAYDSFLNSSTFTWDITVQEPLLTRTSPHAAEFSVTPEDTTTFRVLAAAEPDEIDGVCWQNGTETPVYTPIADATSQGDFLAFAWEADFDFGTLINLLATDEVTATAYIENPSGTKTLIGNTINWTVRAERHVDNNQNHFFSGLEWKVKQSNPLESAIGPGNNYFHSDNVSVDSEGLHLKLVQNESGRWTSAEVFTVNSAPRGIYRFYLEGGENTQLDQLDARVVFSTFLYSDDTREIDIEFSNWSASDLYGEGRLQYIVQPSREDSLNRFEFDSNVSAEHAGKVTCQIDWQDDRVIFSSWLGHSASPPAEMSLLLDTWTYISDDTSIDSFIPESGDELKLRLNLYLKNNRIAGQDNEPDNNEPVHIIVRAIDHPALWEGWRVEQFGERHTLPSSSIGGAQDDPDFDGYPNLLEYALGSDPWRSDPHHQPQVGIHEDPNDQKKYLDFTFTRRQTPPHPLSDSLGGIHHTPFLDYHIMSKTSLDDAIWMDEPMELSDTKTGDGTETVTYRAVDTITEVPQKFLRLQVKERN